MEDLTKKLFTTKMRTAIIAAPVTMVFIHLAILHKPVAAEPSCAIASAPRKNSKKIKAKNFIVGEILGKASAKLFCEKVVNFVFSIFNTMN